MKLFHGHLGSASRHRHELLTEQAGARAFEAPFIPLNAFQRVMHLWDELHPYNGAQVMKLQGRANIDRLEASWWRTLTTLRIGRIRIDGHHYRHDGCISIVPGLLNPSVSLDDFLSAELNRRFAPGDCPFRPFVLQQEGAHFVGVVYLHWVADSESIRMLLREWFRSMYDPSCCRGLPLKIAAQGYWHYFGPDRTHWRLDEGVLALLRLRTRFSRARQTPAGSSEDLRVQVTTHALPIGVIDGLVVAARTLGVTVNDLFLAAVAEACDRYGANPPAHDRDELAVGTIVDLRPMCPQNLADVFGLFFGFTNTIVREQDLARWPRLLRRIAAQTAWQKRIKSAQASTLRLAGALAEARFLSAEHWAERYRQRMPLAAGISNVNMNRHWVAGYHPAPLLGYLRVAPTGPLLPLTFAMTTTGTNLTFTLTRQESLIDADHAALIVGTFMRRLTAVASAAANGDNHIAAN